MMNRALIRKQLVSVQPITNLHIVLLCDSHAQKSMDNHTATMSNPNPRICNSNRPANVIRNATNIASHGLSKNAGALSIKPPSHCSSNPRETGVRGSIGLAPLASIDLSVAPPRTPPHHRETSRSEDSARQLSESKAESVAASHSGHFRAATRN